MNFYIDETENGQGILMSEFGHYLGTYTTVAAAQHACLEWYRQNGLPYDKEAYDRGVSSRDGRESIRSIFM